MKRLCVTADTRDDCPSGAKDGEQGGRASTGCGGGEEVLTAARTVSVGGGHPQVRGAGVKRNRELLRGRSNGNAANLDELQGLGRDG